MRMMVAILLVCCLVPAVPVYAQPVAQPFPELEWTGTTEQKLWGLMQIWSEAKYSFPHQERLEELDWDATVQEHIPRVMAAKDMDSYYMTLMELAALLKDSHTSVLPPWGYFKPDNDYPPVEIQVIEGAFYVVRAGDTEEIKSHRIYPGLEILEIDGVPVGEHFAENVLRYYTRGPKHADEAVLVAYLLDGPKGTAVTMKVKDTDGAVREVSLTRNSAVGDGPPFMYQFVQDVFMAQEIESRLLDDGILYVKIPNYEHDGVLNSFMALIEGLDVDATKGMILDVRNNMGGSSRICSGIVSCLIDESVSSPTERYLQYSAARRAWGRKQEWSTRTYDINPSKGKRYSGPMVILTGPITNSSAEDFVIELKQTGRATTVGGRTSGGAGNPLNIPLPGGGTFRVATFTATFPDGTEYVGTGIEPDIEVYPTAQDLTDGTDPVLKKGVEVARNWEKYVRHPE
jgi:C-terminal processing protease CtpA/Prc